MKTLITVFGTRPNSDTNTIIIADCFPIVNPITKKELYYLELTLFRLSVCNVWAIDYKHANANKAEGAADNNAANKY